LVPNIALLSQREFHLGRRLNSMDNTQSAVAFFAARTTNGLDGRVAESSASKKSKRSKKRSNPAVFQSPKRPSDYQGYRAIVPERPASASPMPILIGAAMIAAAILLSTLITALGTRFVGMESPTEETAWLVDRLTGSVYKCQAPERGKAACEADVATGAIGERPKR
jgi:hypothetical protein